MKKSYLVTTLITIALMAFLVFPVFAQSNSPQTSPPNVLEVILSVFVMFGQLVGVGALIAALVNILKAVKVVADGTAGKWFAGFNLVAIGVLIYFKLFQPQIAIEYLDSQAAVLAQILLLILGYVVELGSGLFAHGLFANLRIPFIGKSYSRERKAAFG